MRKIYAYQNVQNFIESGDEKLENKFQNILAHILNEINGLCEPYVRHVSQNRFNDMYEMRIKASGVMVRVVFLRQDGNEYQGYRIC